MTTQTRSIYGTSEKEVNYERSHTLIEQQKTEELKQNKLTLEIAVLKEKSLQEFAERDEKIETEKTLQSLNTSLQSKATSEHANLITSRAAAVRIEAETLNLIQGQTSSAGAMFSKIKEETVILKAQALEASAEYTAKLKSEAARQDYYKAETKRAEAITLKVNAEAKILVEHTAKEASQGHLYKAGTTLACLGCITGLLALGLYGYKAVQELRG